MHASRLALMFTGMFDGEPVRKCGFDCSCSMTEGTGVSIRSWWSTTQGGAYFSRCVATLRAHTCMHKSSVIARALVSLGTMVQPMTMMPSSDLHCMTAPTNRLRSHSMTLNVYNVITVRYSVTVNAC